MGSFSPMVKPERCRKRGPDMTPNVNSVLPLRTSRLASAVTSNVIWDVGTTAVTSATASPQTCSGKSTEVAKFVLDAYENVVEETARGTGTHVATMLEIYGCDAGSREAIVAAVRPELGAAVGAPGYAGMSRVQKAEQYYLIVTGEIEKNFAASCAV